MRTKVKVSIESLKNAVNNIESYLEEDDFGLDCEDCRNYRKIGSGVHCNGEYPKKFIHKDNPIIDAFEEALKTEKAYIAKQSKMLQDQGKIVAERDKKISELKIEIKRKNDKIRNLEASRQHEVIQLKKRIMHSEAARELQQKNFESLFEKKEKLSTCLDLRKEEVKNYKRAHERVTKELDKQGQQIISLVNEVNVWKRTSEMWENKNDELEQGIDVLEKENAKLRKNQNDFEDIRRMLSKALG